jgi:hypothetical protein
MRTSQAVHTNLAALENGLRLAQWKSAGVEEELKRLTRECGGYKSYRMQLVYAEVLRRKMLHATTLRGEMGFLRQEIRYVRAEIRSPHHIAPQIVIEADDRELWEPSDTPLPGITSANASEAEDAELWEPSDIPLPGVTAANDGQWDDDELWESSDIPLTETDDTAESQQSAPPCAQNEDCAQNLAADYERFKTALIELAERLRGLALPRQILPMVLASRVETPSPAPLDEVQQNLLETAIPQLTLEIASPQLSLEAHCEPVAKTEPTGGSETDLPKSLFIDWLVVCQLVTEDDSVTDPSVDTDLPAVRERIAEATKPSVETDTDLRVVHGADPPMPVPVAAVTARKWHQYKPEPRNRGRKKQRRLKRTK